MGILQEALINVYREDGSFAQLTRDPQRWLNLKPIIFPDYSPSIFAAGQQTEATESEKPPHHFYREFVTSISLYDTDKRLLMGVHKPGQTRGSAPIIMMTAKVEQIDRLLGLELGADDYVCKPFSPRELVARVKAVLRRGQSGPPSPASEDKAALWLDEHALSVTLLGETIELTAIEFKLLSLLFSRPGRIFSRQFILDNIYQDYRVVSDRTVDSHIKKLRKKLVTPNQKLDLIRSVYGSGYKYEPPPQ